LFDEPGESAHLCSSVIIIIMYHAVVPSCTQLAYTTAVAIGIEHINDYTLIRFKFEL